MNRKVCLQTMITLASASLGWWLRSLVKQTVSLLRVVEIQLSSAEPQAN